MAERRPLVLREGRLVELPATDTLPSTTPDAQTLFDETGTLVFDDTLVRVTEA